MARRKSQSDVTRSGHKPHSQRILQSVTIKNSRHPYQNYDYVCHLGRSRAIFRLDRAGDKYFPFQYAASDQGNLVLTVLPVILELIAEYLLHLRHIP